MGKAWDIRTALITPVAVVVVVGALSKEVQSQSTTLGGLGQTTTQQQFGDHIQTVCGQIFPQFGEDDPTPTGILSRVCNQLVENANQLTGGAGGAIDASLGLTQEPLGTAILALAPDEIPAEGTISTETANAQIENITGRMAARRGGAGGLSLVGLSIMQDEFLVAGPDLGFDGDLGFAENAAAGSDMEELLGSRLGLFVSGTIDFGDRDADEFDEESDFDFTTYGMTVGVDYLFSDDFFAGIALGFAYTDTDFQFEGSSERYVYDISIYGSHYITSNVYLDGLLTVGYLDFELERAIITGFDAAGAAAAGGGTGAVDGGQNLVATGDTQAREYLGSIGVGYDRSFNSVTISPFARANYILQRIDAFTEEGSNGLDLRVRDQSIQSLTSVTGVEASYAISTGFGIVQPSARAEWEHEFKNDARSVEVTFAADPFGTVFAQRTDDPDRDYFNVAAGVSALFPDGNTVFADFETVLGLDDVDNYILTVGGRFEFN